MVDHPIRIEGVIADPAETVRVTRWAAQPGARVSRGDLLAIVETAKADLEIEATDGGWLAAIHVAEGAHAPIGATLGIVSDEQPVAGAAAAPASAQTATASVLAPEAVATDVAAPSPRAQRPAVSPRARRAAAAAGLDLGHLSGSGTGGRIVERDVVRAMTTHLPAPRRAAPIVLLHGFGADRSAWRQVVPLLDARETIALDLPGHGAEAASSAFSLEDIAFRLSDRLDALGVEEAHLVGHSLGGAAALALADLGRLAVRSLTLIAPAGLGPQIDGAFIDLVARASDVSDWERVVARMVANASALPQGFAQAAARGRRDAAEALTAMAEALFPDGRQSFDVTGALRRMSAPTRLIWGIEDRVLSSRHAESAPGFAALHLLEGVGHVPPIETPTLVARLILETARSAG